MTNISRGLGVTLGNKLSYSSFGVPRFFFYAGVLLIAQTTWRPVLSFTLSDWCFLVAVVGVLPILLFQNKVEVPFSRIFLIGLGLILVGGLISTPGAQWPLSSLLSLTKMCYLVGIWFWVGIILLHRTEDIQKAVIFWAISAGVSSAAAAAQMIWGDIIPGTSPNWGRMTGFAEHINDLGGITSVALVPALYLATRAFPSPWHSFGYWFIACLIVGGLVWSGSLTSVFAALIGLLVWVVLNKGGLRHVLVLIIGGGAMVFFVYVVSTEKPERPKTEVAKIERAMTEGMKPEGAPPEKKVPTEEAKPEGVPPEKKVSIEGAKPEGVPPEKKVPTEGMKPEGAPPEKKVPTEEAKPEGVPPEKEVSIEEAKPEGASTEKAMTEQAERKRAEKAEKAKTYRIKRGDPPKLVARLIQLKEKAIQFNTVQTRMENFQVAWKSITQDIFVGVGLGPQNGRTETGRLVHNLWISYWYEGGLFAFLGIILLVGAIAKRGIDIIISSDLPIRRMGISIFSAFCTFLVLALAQPIYYKRFEWFPALLLFSLYSIFKAER